MCYRHWESFGVNSAETWADRSPSGVETEEGSGIAFNKHLTNSKFEHFGPRNSIETVTDIKKKSIEKYNFWSGLQMVSNLKSIESHYFGGTYHSAACPV